MKQSTKPGPIDLRAHFDSLFDHEETQVTAKRRPGRPALPIDRLRRVPVTISIDPGLLSILDSPEIPGSGRSAKIEAMIKFVQVHKNCQG